jgi:glycosyltransferase involved in cell wall biosynthesis
LDISVVMTTYNGERWIRAQVDSIISQSRRPDEIIVADDGSHDATIEIVTELIHGSGIDLRVLDTGASPLGTVANIQRALQVVRGDIVVLADQDDIWLPDRLRRSCAELSTGADAVFSDGLLIDDTGNRLPGTLWNRVRFDAKLRSAWRDSPLEVLARRNVVTGATVALKATWLDAVLPIETPLWHDEWLVLIVAAMGGQIVALEQPLIAYRLHDSNAEGLSSGRWLRRIQTIRTRSLPYADIARHFEFGASRVRELGDPAGCADWLDELAAFWSFRGTPTNMPSHIRRSVETYLRGDYQRYGAGWRTLCVDLLRNPAPRRIESSDL